MKRLKIIYLEHSGFLIEGEKEACLFDYWKGNLPDVTGKKLYVFASHAHHDHFNPEIFRLGKENREVFYILSRDINLSPGRMTQYGIGAEQKDRILRVGSRKHYEPGGLAVDTFRSTDAGVAFAVKLEDRWIYHAGDLNWWTWQGEESEGEYRDMTARFQEEIQRIAGYSFALSMLPLDPRQGERFYWGFDYFMRHVETEMAVAMHCWGDDSVTERLKKLEVSEPYRDRIFSPLEFIVDK